jgi:RNA-directed DNA polymerase
MSKTIKNEYYKHLNYDAIYNAYLRARVNKRNKKEILLFELDLETNLMNILNSLRNNTYKMGKYHEFKIYEPKERIIHSLPFKDRIVHQWYIYEFIKPYIMSRLIINTYACINKRGTHKCVLDTQKMMRKMNINNKNYYVLKIDIKKFFYSIDKDLLFNIMSKYITDKYILNLTKIFIYDGYSKGIVIGNYVSQWFANIYLNELDKYLKEELKIKYYTRYCDDGILLLNNKLEAKEVLKKINIFVNSKLHLELNNKTRYFPNKLGINYCGYQIFNDYILLRVRSKKKIRQTIKLYEEGKIDYAKYLVKKNSWLGHAKRSDSYNLINKLFI